MNRRCLAFTFPTSPSFGPNASQLSSCSTKHPGLFKVEHTTKHCLIASTSYQRRGASAPAPLAHRRRGRPRTRPSRCSAPGPAGTGTQRAEILRSRPSAPSRPVSITVAILSSSTPRRAGPHFDSDRRICRAPRSDCWRGLLHDLLLLLRPGTSEPEQREVPKEPHLIRRLFQRLTREGPVQACYEAGVWGTTCSARSPRAAWHGRSWRPP